MTNHAPTCDKCKEYREKRLQYAIVIDEILTEILELLYCDKPDCEGDCDVSRIRKRILEVL